MNYLMSVDISLSKPIFVRKSQGNNKNLKEDKKFDKINEVINNKRKKSDDSLQNNNILNQSINSETSDSKQNDEDSVNNDNKINTNINNLKPFNSNEINIINLKNPKKKRSVNYLTPLKLVLISQNLIHHLMKAIIIIIIPIYIIQPYIL